MTQEPTGVTLPPFEGRPVISSRIKIRKAGDGLSAALDIEPSVFHIGERVFVVLECEASAVNHVPIPKAEGVAVREHVLTTEVATIVDGALVEEALTRQRDLLEEARLAAVREKEAKDGVTRLPGTEPWDDEDDDLPGGNDDEDDD